MCVWGGGAAGCLLDWLAVAARTHQPSSPPPPSQPTNQPTERFLRFRRPVIAAASLDRLAGPPLTTARPDPAGPRQPFWPYVHLKKAHHAPAPGRGSGGGGGDR